MLSQRKIAGKSFPCRVNITVFAVNPETGLEPASSQAEPCPTVPIASRIDASDSNQMQSKANETEIPGDPPIQSSDDSTGRESNAETSGDFLTSQIQRESPSAEAHGPPFRALPRGTVDVKQLHTKICVIPVRNSSAQCCGNRVPRLNCNRLCSTCRAKFVPPLKNQR